jgi:translocation and assembly module TamB
MSRSRKISLRRLVLFGLPLGSLALVLAAAYWLLASGPGARWLWGRVEGASGNAVEAQRVEGSLLSGLTIHDLQYRGAGITVSVESIIIQARPAMWPFSVRVQRLLARDILIHQPPAAAGAGDAHQAGITALIDSLSLPLPVYAERVRLEHIEYRRQDPEAVLVMDSLGFRLAWADVLAIDELALRSAALELDADASLALSSPYSMSLSTSGRFRSPADQSGLPAVVPFELRASGQPDSLRVDLVSDAFGLQIGGELTEPFVNPSWSLGGRIGELSPVVPSLQGALVIYGTQIQTAGSPDDWQLALDSSLATGNGQDAALSVSADGSLSGLRLRRASLDGGGLELDLNGRLDWSDDIRADLRAAIGRLDFSPWVDDWPAGLALAGQLDLNWSANGLQIPSSHLTIAETDLAVNLSADIDLETRLIDAHVDWVNFRWPLRDDASLFDSRSGRLDVQGSVEQWRTSGTLELEMGDYPPGQFQITGQGDRGSAEASLLEGQILGGRLTGKARLEWRDGFKWGLDLEASGIDPEPVIPGWPGLLDAAFRIAAEGPSAPVVIEIDSLQGSLRGVPVNARGKLGVAEDQLWFEQLDIRTDEAGLQLDGNVQAIAGVTARFSGQLPAALLQGASGSMEMEARFSGNSSSPLFEMDLKALDLAWNGWGISAMDISASQQSAGRAIPAIDVNATELRWKDGMIDGLVLSLREDGQGQRLRATVASELLDLDATLDLEAEQPDRFFHSRWNGMLSSAAVSIGEQYRFELDHPAPLSLSREAFSLQPACLRDSVGAAICAGADRDGQGNLAVTADVTALPFDYLRELFDFDVRFEQMLEGRLEWNQAAGQPPTGGADIRITAGKVVDLIDNETLLDSKDGNFKFALRNGNLESGSLDIEFPGIGFIDMDFNVIDIGGEDGRELTGRAVSRLDDIQLIGQLLFPGVDEVNGRFDSDINLGGTLLDPSFEGGFSLTGGMFHYLPIGLKLEDVQFAGQVDNRDRGSLKGQFRAGEGTGVIDGHFQFDQPGRSNLQFRLTGDKLLVINTQSLTMLADTELDIGLSPHRLDLNGRIHVPSANLTPANLLLETVSDSEDLVVESGGVEPAQDDAGNSGISVFGNLEVAFGDEVKVKVPGIETSINGRVAFGWNGDMVPLAEGAYSLDGVVDIYGPRLEIKNGSINFPGVPANNPLLNIRAQRDIFGNTQIRSAGVQVIGTLKRPVLEAFTIPVTNEDRAWTLLVTGSDFDQGQGVGGFDVGTYIAPKLYVSYGVSLFEDENVISARYDLKKGFGIKVTSGQRETGVDISYTLDR